MVEPTSRLQRVDTVRVVEVPEPLVDLDLAKAHLKVQHDEHDTLIQAYIDAALAAIDGPRGWCRRAIAPQLLELATAALSRCVDGRYVLSRYLAAGGYVIDLPSPPVIAIVSVEYETAAGDTVTLDASAYRLRRNACQFASALPDHDELRIRYQAGFAPIDAGSPIIEAREVETARVAALLQISDFYENRESQQVAPGFLVENPAVKALLGPLQLLTVA